MGVPKFFRYISERYPCLSEFVKEYQIPVFDNLYLDMNGIIHMCSHPDDNNPHFRITEEKIFTDIFHYIEFLFSMIKPQKVFFMAVDGVAPRAKMNQQRGRRFRSAKDAEKLEEEAKKKGEKLPDAQRFDSNCITPGTEFMARLHEQLKYFVISKISTDKMWRKCKVILSGHETPGEGEHKIMDYIRYVRSQPGYDPNTRHCLYGLDADLIMLGLCTHEPHFSLLREEVKFGKKTKRSNVPEETRFYLLHLSLMREYLELEFASLKDLLKNSDKFQFDIEKIIDDWILMGFLVGNDFIPNLPNLHIANGALPILYKVYIEVMPTLDGYINEQGTLNLERFEKFMRKLSDIDMKNFEEVLIDKTFFESKTGRKQVFHTPVHTKGNNSETPESEDFSQSVRDPDLAALIQSTSELDVSSEEETDNSSSEDEGFKSFKNEYYRNKLEYQKVTAEVMREQAEGYVRAIQWNLNYYYNGVCSWSWFYPHHYSPYISDIKGFSNLKIDFELGQPFKPYEQLLAVLPTASKNLLPECYHHLMTDESSMIKSYYPENFETDLNGKRQEWEAVVLVPFIDEKILLDAMKPSNELLNTDEKDRNKHGPMLIYEYSEEDLGIYKPPSYFSGVENHAKCTPLKIEDLRVPKDKLIKGAYPGAKFDVFYPGFPTMKHLKYEGELVKAKVKVFEMPSRNENMILRLISEDEHFDDSAPVDLLGQVVWVGWPHLIEARVTAISNKKKKYIFCERDGTNYRIEDATYFQNQLEGITKHSKERLGIDHGKTNILVHVQTMTGRKYVFTSNTRISLEKQFSQFESCFPLQSLVYDIKSHDDCHSTFSDVTDIFSVGSVCFSLTQPYYGSQGTVLDSKDSLKNNQLKVSLSITEEPDLSLAERVNEQLKNNYQTATVSASRLSITSYIFSRITGSLYISTNGSDGCLKSVNIGLDLKFNKRNEEIPGFTKKKENLWLYSNKAVDIVKEYKEKFPEVIEFLSRSEENDMKADDVFKNEPEDKVKEIQTWLRSLPSHNCERRICGSSVLEPEVVAEIEEILDSINETPKDFVMQIKPQLLFKPELQNGNLPPDSSVKTCLFDRIVNIREGYAVPLGQKGTVIGVHKSPDSSKTEEELYDIVFDAKFPKGMALNCSDQRGYRLGKASFINISHGKRRLEQKTGVPGALRARAKERLNNGNSLNGNVMNQNAMVNPRQQNSAFALVNKMQPSINRGSPSKNNLLYPQFQTASSQMQISRTYENQKMKNFPQHQIRDLKINKENSLSQKNPDVCVDKQAAKVPPKSSQKPANPVRARTEVDTEFLKRMLHIDNNSNNAKSKQNPPKTNVSQYDMVQSCSTSSNRRNFSSATAQLLSYYQSNSLGCPRYMYFDEDNGYRAQVLLPHGKYISGKIANTREEASENVALDAINLLKNNPKLSREDLPSHFPVPPSNWMERQHQNKPSQVFVNKSYQVKQHPKVPANAMDYRRDSGPNFNRSVHNGTVSSVNSTAPNFVPLQALKKKQSHVNRVTSGDNINRTSNEKFTRQDKKNTTHPNAQGESTNKVQDGKDRLTKSGRARKTRIAANFHK